MNKKIEEIKIIISNNYPTMGKIILNNCIYELKIIVDSVSDDQIVRLVFLLLERLKPVYPKETEAAEPALLKVCE